MFKNLREIGYQIAATNHAEAIVAHDFPEEIAELCGALEDFRISAQDLIASGGGEAGSTQRLRRDLAAKGWHKHNFIQRATIDGIEREAISHEIDHVRRGRNGTIALEIEWNNKDPFFDRDLENFQRLHALSAISFGVVVTRGASLQDGMTDLVIAGLAAEGVDSEDGLAVFDIKERTARQREIVARVMASGLGYRAARYSRKLVMALRGGISWRCSRAAILCREKDMPHEESYHHAVARSIGIFTRSAHGRLAIRCARVDPASG
ncbi:BglII/BstYI family type II restriction endonuclease [Marinovum algicola]|uniref:BglII/BstYI family type II restriction endonuclease n=1 Tax=Marinovum algicola TaxID=42444 RepID=UPI0032EFDD25